MQATNNDIRHLAIAVNDLVDGAHRGMARTFDVTRIGLLRLAVDGGPLRPTDAADTLAVNPSTVTRYVRTLEDEGFLAVAPDPADRRSCTITATDTGRAELARFEEAGVEVFGAVVHDWTAEDVRQFRQFIERLGDAWRERGPIQTRPPRRTAQPRWKTAPGASRQ